VLTLGLLKESVHIELATCTSRYGQID